MLIKLDKLECSWIMCFNILYAQLMFEAKRIDSLGGSDFALDDISVPETDCSQAPMSPPSPNNTATGE